MKYFTTVGDVEREFILERRDGHLIARCGDHSYCLDFSTVGDGSTFSLLVDGRSHDCLVGSRLRREFPRAFTRTSNVRTPREGSL